MDIFSALSRGGMTIVMITHEPTVAACAKKVYHILDGQILDGAFISKGFRRPDAADPQTEGGSRDEQAE